MLANATFLRSINEKLKKLASDGETSFLSGAQWRVLKAIEQVAKNNPGLKINQELVDQIVFPSKMTEVRFTVDFKGKKYLCVGIRAWFDNGKLHEKGQIVKGGIRFLAVDPTELDGIVKISDIQKARELALDDVMALGLEMLAKNSGTNFSINVLRDCGLARKNSKLKTLDVVGGAKGVILAPRSLHLPDHNEFVRKALEAFGYKLGLASMVGWDRDVPAGDIGTTGLVKGTSVLDGFVDGYERALKDLQVQMPNNLMVAVATGKTANAKYLGNSDRGIATGFGTVEALKSWSESKKKDLKDLTVVFDGAGNAALPAAKILVENGLRVVGMTDSRSAIFVKDGLTVKDIEGIGLIKAKRGSLVDWVKSSKTGQVVKSKLALWKKSDMNVLFISSDAMIINKTNVKNLPEGILIIDGANGPVTPLAEKELAKLKIEHLTGSFANSGGVIGSLIEWAANIADIELEKGEALDYISYSIRSNLKTMRRLVDQKKVGSLAEAFYYMALEQFIKLWLK